MNKRWVRITIGGVFLVFLIVSFIPHLYLSNSSDGVVNAITVTKISPIQGRVEFAKKIRHGDYFVKGKMIGTVTNDRIDKSFLHELQTEKITLETRVEIMKNRLERFQQLHDKLNANLEKYKTHTIAQLERLLQQNDGKLAQEKAELTRSTKDYDANVVLAERNVIKRREYENSEAAFQKSKARILELENRHLELQNTLDAVKSGIFLGDGHNDVPYSSQRQDQLVIEMALAEASMKEAVRRLTGIEKQIISERERIQKMEHFEINAPFDCLVWRRPVSSGSNVVIGSELLIFLDCSTTFLDAAVSESQFSSIYPGEKISYRLKGEGHYHEGVVIARIGSGAQEGHYDLAAKLTKDPKREFRVWIRVDQKDLGVSTENFYKVGQRVEVKFPKNWDLKKEVTRFFNVF